MRIRRPQILLATLACVFFFPLARDSYGQGQAMIGYAIVTPLGAPVKPLVGFATFGLDNGAGLTQATVFPGQVSDSFILYLSNDPATGKDLGVAIVNPQTVSVNVTLKLKSNSGDPIGNPTVITIPAGGHISRFVRQDLFRSELFLQSDRIGSVNVSSSAAIALLGLRFGGANFSPIAATPVGAISDVPKRGSVGGASALLFSQLAFRGGWTSEIVLVNPNTDGVDIRLDLYDENGSPLTATLNGPTASTFQMKLNAGGAISLGELDANGKRRF